ncbi:MAG: PatB family C-S lyase [Bacteroidales bacterium]|nr:PatB family C-S lyase [Bacteroidales bacterium]
MVAYDFDEQIDRIGTACFKYDGRGHVFQNPDVLPLWVADMDFATPSFIIERIRKRCQHPVLGYTFRDDEYHAAIRWWYAQRHGWSIDTGWIDFCPGVVSGLNHAIRAYTQPGDAIIIQPPVYHPFFSTVENNGRKLVLNPLRNNGEGYYTMDLQHLETLAQQGAKMLIISSPHNPVGRVWTRDELLALGGICQRYGLIVVSDEIHSDLVFAGHKHIPMASLSDDLAQRTITFASASKTFNIAGLSSGFAIIPNKELRLRYQRELEASGAGMGNLFGIEAVKAAFSPQGEAWLGELLRYLAGNIDFVERFVAERLPQLRFRRPGGTYLLWLDFGSLGITDKQLNELLQQSAGVGFNAGSGFGVEGHCFQRINVACPQSTVREALERVAAALEVR